MEQKTIKPEIAKENQLVKVINNSSLDTGDSKNLQDVFNPLFKQADKWVDKAKNIIVSDESQTGVMALAREVRLELKLIRVNTEKARKKLKESTLRKGKAIDGIANVIKFLVEPAYEHLMNQEKYIEIKDEEKKKKLHIQRHSELAAYMDDEELEGYDLPEMPLKTYNGLLATAKYLHEQEQENERKKEADRIEAEKKQDEENERIRLENIELKKDKEKKDALLKKEKLKNEKIAKEIEERKTADAKKSKDEADEKRAKLQAPDKEKIMMLARTFDDVEFPVMKSDEAKKIICGIIDSVSILIADIKKQANTL